MLSTTLWGLAIAVTTSIAVPGESSFPSGSSGSRTATLLENPGPLKMNAWMEKRIFPGAYTPTLREMADIFEPGELSILDVENLRLHYARTLEHWLSRFEGHAEEVTRRFDEPFVRAWRLYLTGSRTAFLNGDLQLFQVLFSRARNNELAWSR